VRFVVSINDSKHFGTAGCEQKVVTSNSVFYHREHHVAAIAVERMAFGQVNRFGIVDGSARRQVFILVVEIEANEIGDLFSVKIDYF
jgi:hypothetical protein